MVLIALTGNYTFFNFLTIALCLLCLDDAWWSRLLLRGQSVCNLLGNKFPVAPPKTKPVCNPIGDIRLEPAEMVRPWRAWPLRVFAAFAFSFTALITLPALIRTSPLGESLAPLENTLAPFRSFNTYGLFAVMTNPRPELIIEGSDDGRDWRAYEFFDKPGDLTRAPTWVAPFQPRLDWQLWFAALESPAQNRWVLTLCEHLLRGTPEVLAFFAKNPFPQKPPRLVRVVRYEYHFTDTATRARTGQWWRRAPMDLYVEPASLR